MGLASSNASSRTAVMAAVTVAALSFAGLAAVLLLRVVGNPPNVTPRPRIVRPGPEPSPSALTADERRQLQDALAALKKERDQARQEAEAAQISAAEIAGQHHLIQTDLKRALDNVRELRASLDKTQKDLDLARQEIGARDERIKILERDLLSSAHKLEEADKRASAERERADQLADRARELDAEHAKLEAERLRLEALARSLKISNEDLEQNLKNAREEIETLKRALAAPQEKK